MTFSFALLLYMFLRVPNQKVVTFWKNICSVYECL